MQAVAAAARRLSSPRGCSKRTCAAKASSDTLGTAVGNGGVAQSANPMEEIGHAFGAASSASNEFDLRPLNSPDPHVRQATCQSLGRTNLRGDPRVVHALLARLQDRDQYVRQAAATSLGQVSRRGDEANIAALAARLTDPDAGVRRLSTVALGQVAQRGCAPAITPLISRLDDRDGGVRRAALKALEKVAEKNDGVVLSALFTRTGDTEAFVRHTAVEVLSRIAEEGDAEVVARLLVLLESDRDSRVRWAATEALGRLAIRGDSRVLTALLGRLDDEADSVRRAAANSLGHVTFAPLQELELQERHIAEIEFRGAHEVAARDKLLTETEERHAQEVAALQRRVDELEERLQSDIERRDLRIAELESKVVEQGYLARVPEFVPHAGRVTQFLDTLPSLAGPANYGTEIIAPVWALRCMRSSGPDPGTRVPSSKRGSCVSPRLSTMAWCGEDGSAVEGKERRWLMSLFDLFEQLSNGQVTSLELTDKKPLDVYVHKGDDDAWGLYCCSRHRMMALLMRQACSRNELLTVRCVLRPKDDSSFWAWQWNAFYDGADGLAAQTYTPRGGGCGYGNQSPRSCSPSSSRLSLERGSVGFGVLSNVRGGGSTPSTPPISSVGAARFSAAAPALGPLVNGGGGSCHGGKHAPNEHMDQEPAAATAVEHGRRRRSRKSSDYTSSRRIPSSGRAAGYSAAGRQGHKPPQQSDGQAHPSASASTADVAAPATPVETHGTSETLADVDASRCVPTVTMELLNSRIDGA